MADAPACQMMIGQVEPNGKECGRLAVWSFPSEQGGVIYECEECRKAAGQNPRYLTRLTPKQGDKSV